MAGVEGQGGVVRTADGRVWSVPGGPGVWSVSGHVEGEMVTGLGLGRGGHGSGGYVGVNPTGLSGGQHPVDEGQAGTWYAESQVEQ